LPNSFADAAETWGKVFKTWETKDKEKIMELFWTISDFKEAARNFFLGSIINDTLDGGLNGRLMIELGRKVISLIGMREASKAKTDKVWESIEAKIKV